MKYVKFVGIMKPGDKEVRPLTMGEKIAWLLSTLKCRILYFSGIKS